ncbi:MAG TPA: urease accessory UreF family protein [Candidatus Tectomicrobia bacterium]|nr:urease accessory UreF family protein [Candidatus Tectomicrobia bacterium]
MALLQLCDTALPIGAFAFSSGLETYTQKGLIADPVTLQSWLEAVLHHAVQGSHLLPVALAYRETAAAQWAQLERLDQQLTAMKQACELREMSLKVGQRLLRLAIQVWPGPAIEQLETLRQQGRIAGHHAVVLGLLGWELGLAERVVVEAAGYQWLSGMIAAALRLLALGQSAGQRMLAALLPHLTTIADDIQQQGWDEVCSATPEFDIRAMQHETLYSRLFQS